MISPLVSIIMPAFNAEKTIGGSIQSVLNQTYSNWELIIIDDGSTDSTFETIKNFSDSRIKATRRENCGVASTRNYALSISKGEYIAFLDSDDLWLPEKLTKQVEILQTSDSSTGLIHTNYLEFDERTEYSPKPFKNLFWLKTEGNVHEDLMVHDFVATLTVMIKKEVIEKVGIFSEDLHGTEDWDLWIRIAEHFTVQYIPTRLAKYRLVAGSLSKNYSKYELELKKVLERHLEKKAVYKGNLRLGRWLFHKHMAHGFSRTGMPSKAFSHFILACKARPINFKNVLSFAYLIRNLFRL